MAKQKNIAPAGEPPVSAPTYEIIGLKRLDYMPVLHAGQTFDLANLSEEQAGILIESGYPHIALV
ncbi:hypothetical protein SAMN04487996_10448 [Dyadobacter soli]|uniref:Uncharacterized protein n=1 Tax=Dyadobacter soli TaxID=659014 RepID=A0A1G7B236_9BACT|nr:hypothetical protein [Dyadobacter soli]SDE20897.1 hypothetical protein SAMN04487996_10448 [Dyadobacter soli]